MSGGYGDGAGADGFGARKGGVSGTILSESACVPSRAKKPVTRSHGVCVSSESPSHQSPTQCSAESRAGKGKDGQRMVRGGTRILGPGTKKCTASELGCYFVDCRVRGAPLLWMTRAARSRRWSARLMNGITEFMLRRDNAILGVGSRSCGWYAAVQCPPPTRESSDKSEKGNCYPGHRSTWPILLSGPVMTWQSSAPDQLCVVKSDRNLEIEILFENQCICPYG